jgi:protein-S-isoprenylcysteine O-methyltransferase Ste14
MSRRREANRAEAIVKGVGAIILLLLLLGLTQVLPQMLKGEDPREMIGTMMQIIVGFAMLCGLVAVVGLIVWVKVMKERRK